MAKSEGNIGKIVYLTEDGNGDWRAFFDKESLSEFLCQEYSGDQSSMNYVLTCKVEKESLPKVTVCF